MKELYPILFEPIYKNIMWGGNLMSKTLNRNLPKSEIPVGESWEIVDRKDDNSIIKNGDLKGETIKFLLENYGKEVIGPSYIQGQVFPLLIKIIDAGKRLSLQVHPDEKICQKLGSEAEPKTEMWYIINAKKNANIISGLKEGTDKKDFIKKMSTPDVEKFLQIYKGEPRDSYFIESGRIHAIGAGNLLLEIQQNSNTTYRVSDWGRLGVDGNPRELHVDQAMESIHFDDFSSARTPATEMEQSCNTTNKLVENCPFFKVNELQLMKKFKDSTERTNSFHLITPINNNIQVVSKNKSVDIPKGSTCLISSSLGKYELIINSNTLVIQTT